ncbi:hypothetical protein [Alishewanella longhuensis]
MTYPEPALLPTDIKCRAEVRALALDIACDIHPLNNLRVLQYLTGPLALNEQQKLAWIATLVNNRVYRPRTASDANSG